MIELPEQLSSTYPFDIDPVDCLVVLAQASSTPHSPHSLPVRVAMDRELPERAKMASC